MKELSKFPEEEQWDKRKIVLFLIAAIILIGIGFNARDLILGTSSAPQKKVVAPDIKGAVSEAAPNIQKSVQEQVDNLRNEAENIDLTEIASSSPQVQKVINDLKAIQDYPKNQLKATCEQICNGL